MEHNSQPLPARPLARKVTTMSDQTTIRIKYPDGQISIVQQSNSQLCETLEGVSRVDCREFYKGRTSVVNAKGWNIKQVDMVKLDAQNKYK